jgi:DNA-binding MarR family transcriptional regulator
VIQHHHLPLFPKNGYDLIILHAIRRIIRANDMHSKELAAHYNITAPQLVTLHTIAHQKQTTINALSKIVSLDASTLVGIIDRLESKGFVRRERNLTDRRQVSIQITATGTAFIAKAPSPLQSALAKSLTRLSPLEQSVIAQSLDRIVQMIDARHDDEPL